MRGSKLPAQASAVWFFLLALLCPIFAQVPTAKVNAAQEKARLDLLGDISDLALQATNLTDKLARARAEAEIASALWALDETRAKEILTNAYRLTFPENTEASKSQQDSLKRSSSSPTMTDLIKLDIRKRILNIAARDNAFARTLVKIKQDEINISKAETHFDFAMLAKQAVDNGDADVARKHIISALEADPTQTMGGLVIQDLARKNRAAADELIIEYINMLRRIPVRYSEDWARVYFVLLQLVFPSLGGQENLQPPGPRVMREYATYVVESLSMLEQNIPGSLRRTRYILLTAWSPIQKYAPELSTAFMQLEALSRNSSRDNGPIPSLDDMVNAAKADREKHVARDLESGTPDTVTIEAATRRGEFDRARKAVDRMPDGEAKADLIELIDTKEAIAQAEKGNLANAQRLALKIHTAPRIIEAYVVVIKNSGKNPAQRISVSYQGLSQLRNSPQTPVVNTLAPFTARDSDPRLSALSRLFLAIVSVDDDLAETVLQAVVQAANHTAVDSSQGLIGFNLDIFKEAISRSQLHADQVALELSDPLRRIVALAVIDRWKVEQLTSAKVAPKSLSREQP